jgi:hypothetical protein
MAVNRNNFHSMQSSLNRRFKNGLQFTVNYTLSRNKGTDLNGTPRIDAARQPGAGVRLELPERLLGSHRRSGAHGRTLLFRILARNFRIKGDRLVQFRVEALNAFNTVVISGRNLTAQYASLSTVTTPTNLPYDANGALIPSRALPQSAGFGVATTAQPMRSSRPDQVSVLARLAAACRRECEWLQRLSRGLKPPRYI